MAKAVRTTGRGLARTAKKTEAKRGEVLPPQKSGGSIMRREITLGPLPPPSMLEGYDRVVPGAAKILITQFAEDTQHRRKFEKQGLNFGFILSFLTIMMSIGAIILLAWLDKLQGAAWPIALIAGALSAPSLIRAFTQKDG